MSSIENFGKKFADAKFRKTLTTTYKCLLVGSLLVGACMALLMQDDEGIFWGWGQARIMQFAPIIIGISSASNFPYLSANILSVYWFAAPFCFVIYLLNAVHPVTREIFTKRAAESANDGFGGSVKAILFVSFFLIVVLGDFGLCDLISVRRDLGLDKGLTQLIGQSKATVVLLGWTSSVVWFGAMIPVLIHEVWFILLVCKKLIFDR